MTLTIAVLSDHGAWGIALIIGLLAALAVTALLVMLIRAVDDIDRSASSTWPARLAPTPPTSRSFKPPRPSSG